MNNAITTRYSKKNENGYISDDGPHSYNRVRHQILRLMSELKDNDGNPANQLYEWISNDTDIPPWLFDWSTDFPDGQPWVVVHSGNCEGYILRVLVNNLGAIQSTISMKFLADRPMVERIQVALQRAFDEGAFHSTYRPEGEAHAR